MSRFRIVGVALVLILALTQTACMVSSQNPLIAPESAKVDERLFGQWKNVEKDRTNHYFVGRPTGIMNGPEGLMVMQGAAIGPKHELEWEAEPFYLFTAKVGQDDYLHLIDRGNEKNKITEWAKVEVKSYMILKYTIADDRLTCKLMDIDAAAKAVEGGKLKGEVKRKKAKDNTQVGQIESVMLKESTENLRKYLENGGNKTLFKDEGKLVLTRVKW